MEKRIDFAALELSLMFSDDSDIPLRFKMKIEDKEKINLNSAVEKRFKKIVSTWKEFIRLLLSRFEQEQAWRFITLKPKIESNEKSLAYCKDFIDLTDFFILRRDIENCSNTELGKLALLHTAFQKRVEVSFE
jgi:hypothetical protein